MASGLIYRFWRIRREKHMETSKNVKQAHPHAGRQTLPNSGRQELLCLESLPGLSSYLFI